MPHARPHRPGLPRLALAAALLAEEPCALELAGPGLSYAANTLDAYLEDRHEVFELREGHEGDLARAVFYFYTVYPGRAGPLERITQDGIATLYHWHREDAPDDWERGRNDRIAAVQGNCNFYIDRPDLVCRAWGFPCKYRLSGNTKGDRGRWP